MARLSEKPIYLKQNPYGGPNAHLLSLQQTPDRDNGGMWHSFHNTYISHIAEELNSVLPDGYMARSDQSLQLEISIEDIDERLPPRRPDVAIYERTGHLASAGISTAIMTPDIVFPIEELASDTEIAAVVIYSGVSHRSLGEPIVRIELLSDSNKRGGSGLTSYRKGRRDTFGSGVTLYELDLLHESASPLDEIPAYPTLRGSHPYYVAVTDSSRPPRETRVKFFDVDDPFPLVNILLRGDDIIRDFDFGISYNETFVRGIWGKLLDYADEPDPTRQRDVQASMNRNVPPALAAYSPADQARITERMHAIIESEANK